MVANRGIIGELLVLGVICGAYKSSTLLNSCCGCACRCVLEAKEKGYTEPDPRDDLNGTVCS